MEAKVCWLTTQLETTQQDGLTKPILRGVGEREKNTPQYWEWNAIPDTFQLYAKGSSV